MINHDLNDDSNLFEISVNLEKNLNRLNCLFCLIYSMDFGGKEIENVIEL